MALVALAVLFEFWRPGVLVSGPLQTVVLTTMALVLAGLVSLAFLAPRYFEVDDERVVIGRRLFNIELPLISISDVEVRPSPVGSSRPVLGIKHFFGHWGRFFHTDLGVYRLYATNSGDTVILRTAHGIFGITPERPHEFAERVEAAREARVFGSRRAASDRSPVDPRTDER